MFSTISSRIIGLLVGFALLLGAGALSSYVVLKQQADDGLLVNLAGRQRMLTQKMTKESTQLVNAAREQKDQQVSAQRDELQKTMRVFEMTLFALKDGGPAPVNLEMTRMRQAPAAAKPEIAKQLDVVASLWEPFKKNLDAVVASNGSNVSAAHAVIGSDIQLMDEMNKAVTLMQGESEQKVSFLLLVQNIALASGLLLVGVGIWVARTTIVRPLVQLADAARTMSTGNLNVELNVEGSREVKELGASFDRLRASMVAALSGGIGGSSNLADDDL
jgi:methyl-accepting chemotaxis protein